MMISTYDSVHLFQHLADVCEYNRHSCTRRPKGKSLIAGAGAPRALIVVGDLAVARDQLCLCACVCLEMLSKGVAIFSL